MGFSDDDLNRIYDKTDGYCAHCGKKLSFCNWLINKNGGYPLGVLEDRQVYGRRRFVGNRGT